jgi:hypothetical protein
MMRRPALAALDPLQGLAINARGMTQTVTVSIV